MQRLPLYSRVPTLTIERVAPATLDDDCSLCELGAKARKRCLPAVGEAGGLLVVDERPTREDEAAGQLFQSETARTVRRAIEAAWEGPAAYATATRCVGKAVSLETSIDACRGFMSQTLADVQPKRIIVMGPWAAYSLLGRTVSVERARRAYAWTSTGVPVLVIQSPLLAVRGGRFHRRAFDEDLTWALTTIPPIAPQRGDGLIVATAAEAIAAAASLRAAGWFSFDCETAGEMFSADFRLLCLSACGAGDQHAFVWDAAALADSEVSGPLVQLLVDPTVGKTGQNLKYDMLAVRCGLGVEAIGVRHDTRLVRKLLEPDSVGDLDTMAELVGMGGHKDEAQAALSTALKTIGKKLAAHRDGVTIAPLGHQLDETEEALVRLGANPKRYAFAMLPREVLLRYNARDAVATTRLAELLEARLTLDSELERVWQNVVLPASVALERVEAWGVAFDAVACGQLRVRLTRDLEEINRRFAAYGDFNPASSAQVSALLFDRLRLRPHHLTDSGKPSTDAESLEHLAQTNEVARDLLEHRRLSKLKGTYAEGLAEHVRDDGRIHPNIKLDGARSGRTSCIRRGTPIEIVRDVVKFPKGVAVEDVRVGDLAYCYDATGGLRVRRVLKVWSRGKRSLVRVRWRGQGRKHTGYLDMTPDHRVMLVGGEWRQAGSLCAGDRVVALSRNAQAGYQRLYPTGLPCVSREHRLIFSEVHGWSPEHVHHANGVKSDNRIENLEGKTAAAHLSAHGATTPQSLRTLRSEKMKQQHASGTMPPSPSGSASPCWLGLSRAIVERLLVDSQWSVTNAARLGGYDFATFRRYVVAGGFALDELRKMNRETRRDQIVLGAAKARAAKHNHEVLSVEHLTEQDDVFDLMIDEHHNFVAGELCVANCSQPNLQQIPRAKDTGDGKLIRDCFVAPPGTVLIEFDYAQIELRVAAMLSGDPLMREIFISGDDYHLRTAKLVARQAWGIDPEMVEDRHRSIAKTFNFMVLYGGGDAGLAARIGCTVGEAAQIRAAILGKFKDLASWIQGQLAGARRTGETRTWWDGQPARRRPLWDVFSPDSERRSKAEHGSWNSAIQGTASDYCLSSLAAVVQWLEADGVPAKLVLAVHDSLLLEVDISAVDEVAHQVRRIMTSWPVANGVPLEVDAKIGPSWGTMSTYDFSSCAKKTGA